VLFQRAQDLQGIVLLRGGRAGPLHETRTSPKTRLMLTLRRLGEAA
jgi:hypothetical protein